MIFDEEEVKHLVRDIHLGMKHDYTARDLYDECKNRLTRLSLHDPIIRACIHHREYLTRIGHYEIVREDMYAMMAFELFKAKRQYEKLSFELANSKPAPIVIHKENTVLKAAIEALLYELQSELDLDGDHSMISRKELIEKLRERLVNL